MIPISSAAARAIVPADGWPVARVAPSGKVSRTASVIIRRIIGLLVRIRQTGVVVWSNGNLGKYIICLTSYYNMRQRPTRATSSGEPSARVDEPQRVVHASAPEGGGVAAVALGHELAVPHIALRACEAAHMLIDKPCIIVPFHIST